MTLMGIRSVFLIGSYHINLHGFNAHRSRHQPNPSSQRQHVDFQVMSSGARAQKYRLLEKTGSVTFYWLKGQEKQAGHG
jgi:hypothetical protein